MKALKFILILFTSGLLLQSCKSDKNTEISQVFKCPMACEGDKTYSASGNCVVCKMDLVAINETAKTIKNDDNISQESIFNLTSKWQTEENKTIELKALKGKTLVMVMIYTSCKAACPRLVADMRNIEAQLPPEKIKDIQFVLISIDPLTDTPKRLKSFAIENIMDGEQWMFLQGTESSVREFANVLSMKYKQISPIDFSHSNIISVFNPAGELIHQQEGLGVDNKETIETILKTVH
ncbi:SCO1/SenC family protein [Algibacter lectus]|uniref:SCO1/SenC family protein n=1 Tax=Algibacter lectus TaxID=221126 RepID=A0A090WTR6_9FLAO|nr:SCO family protein [Algibacter lectus]GAL78794.1 SCO1/SenC family protein [Algibacter lectus]